MFAIQEYIDDIFDCCNSCLTKYLQLIDELSLEAIESTTPLWLVLKEKEVPDDNWITQKLECPSCEEPLKLNSLLIEDELNFVNKLTALTKEKLEENIYECQSCNTDKIIYIQMHGDPLNLNTISNLFDAFDIPMEIRRKLDGNIQCRCGNSLEEDQPYLTELEHDYWIGVEEAKYAEQLYETFNIPKIETEEFVSYLFQYPMLAMNDPMMVGKRILEKFKENNVPGIVTLIEGQFYYRARKRDPITRHIPYVESELWAPPIGLSGHGRYNPAGVSILYLADSMETACKEVDPSEWESIEVAKFISLEDITIWDVRNTDIKDFVSIPSANRGTILREYIFPNFLAQCAGSAGIHGIIYDSVKHSNGFNLALLNYTVNQTIVITKHNTYNRHPNVHSNQLWDRKTE